MLSWRTESQMSIGVGGRFGEHSRRDPVVVVGEKGGVAFVCEMRSGGEGLSLCMWMYMLM